MNDAQLSRREFWIAGGAGALLAGLAGRASGQGAVREPKFEFIFHLEADLEPPQMIGATGKGTRVVYVAKGGTIEGPNLKGTVLPGPVDWLMQRDDGVAELDVRASIRTDDGELVYTHYKGLSHNKTEDGSRYFITTPRFETSAEKYSWLNNIVAVGVGSNPGPNKVAYDVFKIS